MSGILHAKNLPLRPLLNAVLSLLGVLLWLGTSRAETQPAMASLDAGGTRVTGVFFNSSGHLVAPLLPDHPKQWTVAFENERYAATVVTELPHHGIVILKVERKKPFPFMSFDLKQAPLGAKLRLVGLDKEGKPLEREVAVGTMRFRLADLNIDQSCYPIVGTNELPCPGALLVDSATGRIYGMLLDAKGENGERYSLLGSCIRLGVGNLGFILGSIEPVKGPQLVFADGHTMAAHLRRLDFQAVSELRTKTVQARAKQDWRENTGFWLNTMTSPVIEGDSCFFGSSQGQVYCINMATMQREWLFPTDRYPVFFPPSVGTNVVCIGTGSLNLQARASRDEGLADVVNLVGRQYGYDFSAFQQMFTFKHTARTMFDQGVIYCADRKTGVFKWQYETRFVSQPFIKGDRVVFGGLETLGVLNMDNGKPVWVKESDRNKGNPTFYVIAGVTEDKVYVMALPTQLTGGTNKNPSIDPLRLTQDNRPARVECYSLKDGTNGNKPLWSTLIKAGRGAPALSGMVQLSADGKTCVGADAKQAFAIETATGKVLWQTPVFETSFGGNMAYGDGFLFVTSIDHKMYALDASDGKVAWTFAPSKDALCIPLVKDGIVYVGSFDTNVYALDARTGKQTWKFETGGKICGQPRIIGNKLYCMTDEGRLSEIELPQ